MTSQDDRASDRVSGSTKVAFGFARRELRAGLQGFRIFLACLILGVAAIAGVGSVSQSMVEGLRNDGRALLGGDMALNLIHREADENQQAWLSERATVSRVVEMRAMARGQSTESKRVLIELRAVDNLYPLYGEVELGGTTSTDNSLDSLEKISLEDALSFTDGAWGAAIDPRALRRLQLEIGDRVTVGDATFVIRATLLKEPDHTTRAFTLGPTFMIAADSLDSTGLIQPGSMTRYDYRIALPAELNVLDFQNALKETFPHAGWRIRDATAAAPRVSQFIDRLTLFLTLVGLTALLVGGVGVGNATRSYLESRTATIATLKCLGAPGKLIFKVYLIQILLLAALGTVIGLTIGAIAPMIVATLIGDSLGWNAVVGLYPIPLITAAVFGLLTALTFSLWALGRARDVAPASLFRSVITPAKGHLGLKTTLSVLTAGILLAALVILTAVNQKIAIYFVIGALIAFSVFYVTALGIMALARKAPRFKIPSLRLAVANLYRPGAPTPSVVLSLGLGLTVLVTIAQIEGNLTQQVEQNLPEEAPGFYFIDIQPDQIDAFDALVKSIPGTSDLQRVPMLRGRISAVNGVTPDQLTVPSEIKWIFRGDRGLTWSRQPPPNTNLTTGTWWPADYDGKPLVSLDEQVAKGLNLGIGDRLTINILGRDVEVEIANLRAINWSQLSINFVMVFSPGLLSSAPQTQIATVRAEPEVEDRIERAVTDRFVNISSIRVKEALNAVSELLEQVATSVRATASIALFAGVLVLAGAVAAGHHRRVYDAVILKVLGATRATIGRAFLLEYGLLGCLTAAIAAVLGSLAAFLVITEIMRLDFIFQPWAVVSTAIIATAITLLFGFAGTWRALGQKAAPLLRNE
ncbi:ABC transporter permease [Pelagibius sp. Alg239-R121]|uniref:ABC transporter permease n=1 Tax=Pelagibius sp. Alg239-R121 TaxID=2993448 RepID=UPI0024A72824|nr:FtsX-like permease family protein [Pelagibius sp. Alg239-R121]